MGRISWILSLKTLIGFIFGKKKEAPDRATFTYKELAKATKNFSDKNCVGGGGFGKVYRGKLRDKREVAVKQLNVGGLQGEREFNAEVEIIRSTVNHEHLVTLIGYCIHEERRLLVYDFVPNNTLEFHLHGRDQPTVDWSKRMKIALGVAEAIAYLHDQCNPKIVHRDVKAANILLDFNFEAKVTDFGLAKILETEQATTMRIRGTQGYMPPEYIQKFIVSEKSDVYAYGVILLELITGQRPVLKRTFSEDVKLADWAMPKMKEALTKNDYGSLVDSRLENYNLDELRCLVNCAATCIHYSPAERPKMAKIVRFLKGEGSLEELNPSQSNLDGIDESFNADAQDFLE